MTLRSKTAHRILFSRQNFEAHIRERIRELKKKIDQAIWLPRGFAGRHTMRAQIRELERLLDHWGMKP